MLFCAPSPTTAASRELRHLPFPATGVNHRRDVISNQLLAHARLRFLTSEASSKEGRAAGDSVIKADG